MLDSITTNCKFRLCIEAVLFFLKDMYKTSECNCKLCQNSFLPVIIDLSLMNNYGTSILENSLWIVSCRSIHIYLPFLTFNFLMPLFSIHFFPGLYTTNHFNLFIKVYFTVNVYSNKLLCYFHNAVLIFIYNFWWALIKTITCIWMPLTYLKIAFETFPSVVITDTGVLLGILLSS